MGDLTINMALGSLGPEDDNNWTHDGLPRMDVIEKLIGDKSIIRKDITDAAPEFCREVAAQRKSDAETEKAEAQKVSGAEAQKEETDNGMQRRQEKAEEPPQVNPEEVLRAEMHALDEAISRLSAQRSILDKEAHQLQRRRDALQEKSYGQHSAAADTRARMDFIKSQNKARAGRFEKGRKILAAIGKDGLNPKCRLDQAMSRKTARGTRRPPARTPKQ